MGIRRETLIEWKKAYPNISNTLKRGKEVIDRQVENALLKRALGYSYKETTRELVVNKTTGEVEGKTYFVANDVAKALGYSNPSKATNDHCKNAIKAWGNDSLGRQQEFKVIPEGDIYRLVIKSQLPSAERFERWIFDEVLPSIRKHGMYALDELHR